MTTGVLIMSDGHGSCVDLSEPTQEIDRRAEFLVVVSYAFHFDKETAMRIAELLEQDGNVKAAADVWWRLILLNPYERRPREKFADLACQVYQFSNPPADVAKSRLILRVMSVSFPTPRFTSAYFDNLRELLQPMPRRARPGRVVLGVGSGRCGSTSLTGAMAGVPGACATHENPPVLYWEPLEEQIQVHVERFRILTQYFAVVFDASHWWLNALERLFGELPDVKAIGLYRETQACAQSFLNQKGSGKGSPNHWAVPGNDIWAAVPGDPCYPSYPLPESLVSNPDAAKRAMVTRYVSEYNQTLQRTAAAHPDRLLLVRTEDLSNAEAYARMSDFLGFELRVPSAALNVGGTADSDQMALTF